MKYFSYLFIFLFLGFPISPVHASQALTELEKTPLPDLQIPSIQRRTLKNGMRVLLLPDHTLPVVRGYLYVRTGSIFDPPEKVGLASLTGDLLRDGGTQAQSPEQFDQTLAKMGAEVESEISREYGLVAFKALKEDLPTLLKLVFEMLREPGFNPQKLELNRLQMLEALRRQNDDPAKIAMREFPKLLFGPESVWSRSPTVASIRALTRQDVLEFYQKYFFPNRMILALSGDFQEKEALKSLEDLTASWAKSTAPLPKIPALQKLWESGSYLAKKNTDQSTVILGHFGDKRSNPDKYALLLLNEILGGDALSSRLGQRIRSTLGLAYNVYSQFGLQTDFGVFFMMLQTKAATTSQALSEALKILGDIRKKDNIQLSELDFYKQSLLNSLFSQYEPLSQFAKEEARFEYFGYPPNYLQFFKKKIQKVSLADLTRVAQKYLQQDKVKVLVVGDPAKVGELPGAKEIDIQEAR